MKGLVRITLIYLFTGIYTVIGTVGHFAPSALQSNFFNESSQLSGTKNSNPQGQRPVWSKKKHFPPATQVQLTSHLRPAGGVVYCASSRIRFSHFKTVVLPQFLLSSASKPRDPPGIA